MNVEARVRLFTSALLLPLAPMVARAVERPLTLDEAIQFALEKNESILIERKCVASADATVIATAREVPLPESWTSLGDRT